MIGPVGMAAQGIGLEPRWGYVKLKYLLESVGSGGTPNTDVTSYWAENGEDGFPWVAIADMSRTRTVSTTAKRVTPEGLRSKGLAVWPSGTLLMSMYASLGHVATLGVPAATNQAILALHPRNNVDPGFLRYWLTAIRPLLKGEANSNTQDNLNAEKVANLPATKPPLAEQRSIAAFLDYETARIDELVREQERLIALIREQRQKVVLDAVTNGLDNVAARKSSGLDGLGKIPDHWRTARLKHEWNVIDCKHITAEFVPDGIPLASIREVQGFYVDVSNARQTTEEDYLQLIEGGRQPTMGDIIYSRNASVGEAAIVATDEKFAMGQDVCLLRQRSETTSSEYFLYQLRSFVVLHQLEQKMVGATFKRINVDAIKDFHVVVPPPAEQHIIAEYLAEHTQTLDDLLDAAFAMIQLLQERRSALISASVTGQLDLRDWQPVEVEHVAEVA